MLENHERFTLCLLLQPRLRSANTQVICSNRDESAQGFQLEQLSNGQLALRMSSTGQDHLLSLEAPLHLGSWYRVLLSVDGPAQRAALIATDLRSSYKQERELCTNTRLRLGSKAQLSLASASAHKPLDCFNGRIEDPWLLARILDGEQTRELADAAADPDCIAAALLALSLIAPMSDSARLHGQWLLHRRRSTQRMRHGSWYPRSNSPTLQRFRAKATKN
ncbi:MAG: hypothetical protein EBX64_08085 [Betaproteobacteria bacterium]|nr:hypothetical protein [Betaproteobacteria bacterium]